MKHYEKLTARQATILMVFLRAGLRGLPFDTARTFDQGQLYHLFNRQLIGFAAGQQRMWITRKGQQVLRGYGDADVQRKLIWRPLTKAVAGMTEHKRKVLQMRRAS